MLQNAALKASCKQSEDENEKSLILPPLSLLTAFLPNLPDTSLTLNLKGTEFPLPLPPVSQSDVTTESVKIKNGASPSLTASWGQ